MQDAPDAATTITRGLHTLRFIVGALIAGVVLFAGVSLAIVSSRAPSSDPALARLLLQVLAVLGAGELLAYPAVRTAMVAGLRRTWAGRSPTPEEAVELLRPFTTLTILGAAMCEGFSLFAVTIHLISGSGLALAGVALGLLGSATFFPGRESFRRFVERVTAPLASHPT